MDLDKVNFCPQEIHRGCLQMSSDLLQASDHLWGRHPPADLPPAQHPGRHPGERLPDCQLRVRPLPGEGGLPQVGQAVDQGGGGRHHQGVRGGCRDPGPDISVPGRC